MKLNESQLREAIKKTIESILSEGFNSKKLRDYFIQHGGIKRLYTQDELGDVPDKRVTQDGLGDVTDEQIVYMEEYPDAKAAQEQAWYMQHPKDRRGRLTPTNTFYTVYKANDGSAIVVGLDKSKFPTDTLWGGEGSKKRVDRVKNNGWSFKSRSNRYNDDSGTYYTGEKSPVKDFGYKTSKDYKNMLSNLEKEKKSSEEQQGKDNYVEWRRRALQGMRDYMQRHYPKK